MCRLPGRSHRELGSSHEDWPQILGLSYCMILWIPLPAMLFVLHLQQILTELVGAPVASSCSAIAVLSLRRSAIPSSASVILGFCKLMRCPRVLNTHGLQTFLDKNFRLVYTIVERDGLAKSFWEWLNPKTKTGGKCRRLLEVRDSSRKQ